MSSFYTKIVGVTKDNDRTPLWLMRLLGILLGWAFAIAGIVTIVILLANVWSKDNSTLTDTKNLWVVVPSFVAIFIGMSAPEWFAPKSRQRIIRKCVIGEQLQLIREKRNKYDRNAITVCRLNGEQLGYIGADLAEDLAPDLDAGQQFVVAISDLTGGSLFRRNRGVNIQLKAE